jgi:hypothetical protein
MSDFQMKFEKNYHNIVQLFEDFIPEDLKSKVIINQHEEYLDEKTKAGLREFTKKFTETYRHVLYPL